MTGIGHLLIGVSTTAATLSIIGVTNEQLVAGSMLGAFASLLPDIDAKNSTLQHLIYSRGNSTFTDTFFSYRSRRGIISGFIYTLVSVLEMVLRTLARSLIEIMKLFVKHRGITHTLMFSVLILLILFVLLTIFNISFIYALAFFVGYISHLLADACTISGLKMLAPVNQKTIYLLPYKHRIRTEPGMSFGEVAIVFSTVFLSFVVVVFTQPLI